MLRALLPSFFFFCLALVLGQGFSIAHFGRESYRRVEASVAVQRMAENSYRYFEGRRPPAGPDYWKAIGRNAPLLDPWGEAYVFEHLADGAFLCRSAGGDRTLHTPDDIIHLIPYGQALEPLQPRKNGQDPNLNPPPEQRVRDAK